MARNRKEGFIYLMKMPDKKVVKIGYSMWPLTRRDQLITQYGEGVDLIATFYSDNAYQAETAMLRLFRHRYEQVHEYGAEAFKYKKCMVFLFTSLLTCYGKMEDQNNLLAIHQFHEWPGNVISFINDFYQNIKCYPEYLPALFEKYGGKIYNNRHFPMNCKQRINKPVNS